MADKMSLWPIAFRFRFCEVYAAAIYCHYSQNTATILEILSLFEIYCHYLRNTVTSPNTNTATIPKILPLIPIYCH